jgi:DNA-binding NtrC family response regulator
MLPPLKERAEDIKKIAQYYLTFFTRKYNLTDKNISDDVYALMKNHAWPGNIRSLKHAIERAVVMSENNIITADDLQLTTDIVEASAKKNTETGAEINAERAEEISTPERDFPITTQAVLTKSSAKSREPLAAEKLAAENSQLTTKALSLNLAENERTLIVQALQQCNYHITKTAKALGLTRAALYRRMEKYDL